MCAALFNYFIIFSVRSFLTLRISGKTKPIFMKRLHLLFAGSLLALTVITQPATAQQKKDSTALKTHHCTAACKNGKHVYAHGEKGHVCGDACKKAEKSKMM